MRMRVEGAINRTNEGFACQRESGTLTIERDPRIWSVHFVLAYNRVDAGGDSDGTYTVGVPHGRLCEFPVARHVAGTILD